ncbi:unnamed protein product [Pleuronectes platessa]|uniref:MAM domain-containing protein n=1 Tax=Pleuronectes platessa TaxID=8262 RepID=A0A9N7UBM1_PLEPL|nr:unnamed protein product [Pleuronectes platessa]
MSDLKTVARPMSPQDRNNSHVILKMTDAHGYSILIETKNNLNISSAARLVSLPQPAGQICVSFWHHIFGNSIGTLKFIVKHPGEPETLVVWMRCGTQEDTEEARYNHLCHNYHHHNSNHQCHHHHHQHHSGNSQPCVKEDYEQEHNERNRQHRHHQHIPTLTHNAEHYPVHNQHNYHHHHGRDRDKERDRERHKDR